MAHAIDPVAAVAAARNAAARVTTRRGAAAAIANATAHATKATAMETCPDCGKKFKSLARHKKCSKRS